MPVPIRLHGAIQDWHGVKTVADPAPRFHVGGYKVVAWQKPRVAETLESEGNGCCRDKREYWYPRPAQDARQHADCLYGGSSCEGSKVVHEMIVWGPAPKSRELE
jgi:hypothetical protein